MENLLTYKQYLIRNKNAFDQQQLGPQQRQAKYDAYLAKHGAGRRTVPKIRGIPVKGVPYRPPLPSRTNSNYSQAVIANNRRFAAPRNSMPRLTKSTISECTLLYAQASIDPFAKLDKDPCIPDAICVPSFKYNTTARGTAKAGAGGICYIAFNPWDMAVNDNGNSTTHIDQPLVFTTDAYDLTYLSVDPLLIGTKLATTNSNSFFSVAAFETPLATTTRPTLRLVAAGLEIFYTGQLLDQSGAITTFQNGGLQPQPTDRTPDVIKKDPRAVTCAVSKDARCYISYYTTSTEFLNYRPLDDFRASNINSPDFTNNHPLIIVITGAEPGISFEFYAKSYFEAVLPGMNATPSEADPIGYPALQAARTQMLPSSNPEDDLKDVLQGTLRNIGHSISGIAPDVGTAIGTVFGQPMLGRMAGTAAQGLLSSLLGGQASKLH
jgi:hypothetical protein